MSSSADSRSVASHHPLARRLIVPGDVARTRCRQHSNYRLHVVLLVSVFLTLAALTMAEDSKSSPKRWTAEDIVFQEWAGQFKISHDAKWVVWVRSVGDKDKDATVSRLVLSSLTDTEEIQLTRGSDTVDQPCWSPDDKYIAFLSTRPLPKAKPQSAEQQIWLVRPNGGEPWPVTELSKAPQQIAWLDKRTIIFSAEESVSLFHQELKDRKDDSTVVDDEAHKSPVRLYQVHIETGKITELTSNADQITTWAASPDGTFAVARHRLSLHEMFDQKIRSQVILHNLRSGTEKRIMADLASGFTSGFAWMPDNSGFYATIYQSSHPTLTMAAVKLLYHYNCATGKTTQVNLQWENGLNWAGVPPVPTADGFLVLLAAGTRFVPARYVINKTVPNLTWNQELLQGDDANNLNDLTASEDGKIVVYVRSSASSMPQAFRAQLERTNIFSPVALPRLNTELVQNRAFAKSEIVRWAGAKEEEVEGVLTYPVNYQPGRRFPLVTVIHGGPMNADQDWWMLPAVYPVPLLNQRDAFVLRPNYHGSSNRGLAWLESICCGHYLEYEALDVNKGVDSLISRGLVDPDRVATMGWSYGSIVSIGLITQYPSRYKAATLGAGDVEYISDWGNTDFGHAFDYYYIGKTPMEAPDVYIRKSPFFQLDKVRTPVVIFHGTADRFVPPAQSWSFFRALQYNEHAPVKLVLLPGEPHDPEKPTHQLRIIDEEMAWLDKYFFKTVETDSESVKQSSPLDDAIKASNCKRNNPYGQTWSSPGSPPKESSPVLIPETVLHGEQLVGCFEVTRAQYAAFNSNYRFPAATANFPATGITSEEARSYTKWLAHLTGQEWRLPRENELDDLFEDRDGQNTLDYWAGYSPNREDTANLQEQAKNLPGSAPLLKEVGSFRGQGREMQPFLFDLGGNAAEWVTTSDGKSKVVGGSADCPADPSFTCIPAQAYIGFRVVRSKP